MTFVMRVAAIFAALTSTSYCQSFHFGGSAGATFFQFYGNDAHNVHFDDGLTAGFSAQGQAEVSFSDIFGLRAGVGYCMKGAGMELRTNVPPLIDITTKTRIRLDYLEFPVEARIALLVDATTTPYATAGILPAVLINAETSADVNGNRSTSDNTNDYETLDLEIPLGGGVAFEAGPGDLFIEGKFIIGTLDIVKSNAEMKNRGFSMCVGYRF